MNNLENKENKKTLINKKVETYELYKYAEIIAKKALKIIECKGNKKATEIIENKSYYKLDEYEDIKQTIIENIIENNYTITKQTYYCVNRYINNIIKDETQSIKTKKYDEKTKKYIDTYIKIENTSIDAEIEKDENTTLLNYISYLEYNQKSYYIENTKKENAKNIINALQLTEKQTEILNMYSKLQNKQKTAELLGISKQAIDITIKRIKEKLIKLDIKIV